jgi:ribonuclease Z
MPTVHLLGTGAVVSDPHRTTTMVALDNGRGTVLVDCGGDAVPRLAAAGLDPRTLDALIVTHEHADHVAGFPLMMERLWLLGRRTPLPVHGIAEALAQVARSHDAFDTSGFEDYAGWTCRPFAAGEGALVLEAHGWRVTAAPGVHAVPTVGLRFHDLESDTVVVISGDTAPTPAITRLAQGCDLLLHEATGAGPVHSDAVQAAETARAAGAGRLVLVHLPPAEALAERLPAARAVRPDLEIGEERARYRV